MSARVAALRDARSNGSLLYPGMDIPAGSGFCCSCPFATFDADAEAKTRAHHEATHHPTVYSRPNEDGAPA